VEDVYRQVVTADDRPDGRVTLDMSAVTGAVHDALAELVGPEAAAQFARAEPVRVTIGEGATPRLGDAGRRTMPIAWLA
uniref:hypothetical protein n=1 Tax=Salmonella sp. SAL4447 TaxID=3159902 RepID=UPI00397C22BF